MKITINIPDKVFKTCKEDEYFNMRVDFNANDNTIESITIDDGYELTKADFIVNEQSTKTEKLAFINEVWNMLLSDMSKKGD